MVLLTKQELEDLAILSKLEIKDEEVEDILKDMENIIEFANKINSAEVLDVEQDEIMRLENVFRKDEVLKSYPQEEILKNSKTHEDGFFYLNNVQNDGGKGFDS